ncbi:MAG: hypothetical protein HYR56_03845 [Acidobacteria bacterium]|nr:hypothetical protein [Acidobacteriota bacterium]MBI3426670.1 hypothetical protein [Acidobacteriota bacterium]
MPEALDHLLQLIHDNNGISDKARLAMLVSEELSLTKDRSVYYCAEFAIRFSSSASRNFGNTVLSLSNLKKYDDRPFIVCLVTPAKNFCLIANTTFLKKISHSSQELRVNNIRGSFNGSDIVQNFEGIENCAENIVRLFAIHADIGFEGNLARLVEATNNISPSGSKFTVGGIEGENILAAPSRAIRFVASPDVTTLKDELDDKVARYKNEILLAALIENVNVRGRVIEYLIAGDDESLRQRLIESLKSGSNGLPSFKTANTLGDYQRHFDAFDTETDVKTKILILNSNPKAYNLDKMLEFLAGDRSVFMFYFVGVDPGRIVNTALVSMFQKNLLDGTILLRHWAGRNSRGVSQFEGKAINGLIERPSAEIDEHKAKDFLVRILAL